MNDRTRELECVISDLKQRVRDAEKSSDELLAALQDVDALWMHHSIAHGDGKISPLHEKVIAAIAKATGEQP